MKSKRLRSTNCVMPQYEVPVTETPGLNPEDRPAMRRMVDEGFLDMGELAAMERGKLAKLSRHSLMNMQPGSVIKTRVSARMSRASITRQRTRWPSAA